MKQSQILLAAVIAAAFAIPAAHAQSQTDAAKAEQSAQQAQESAEAAEAAATAAEAKAQVAEGAVIRFFKSERTDLSEIEPGKTIVDPFWKGQCILNWQLHIGYAHLRFYTSVFKLHHGMNDALRMYHNLYLIRPKVEQPFCFNHFQAFIHEGCRVHADFSSHVPVGMLQCMFSPNIQQIIWLST